MFKTIINFIFHRNDWIELIDVYSYFYKNKESLAYSFTDKDGKVINYCGAIILYSKSRNRYKAQYYGNDAKEHGALQSHTNKLLCMLNSSIYDNYIPYNIYSK